VRMKILNSRFLCTTCTATLEALSLGAPLVHLTPRCSRRAFSAQNATASGSARQGAVPGPGGAEAVPLRERLREPLDWDADVGGGAVFVGYTVARGVRARLLAQPQLSSAAEGGVARVLAGSREGVRPVGQTMLRGAPAQLLSVPEPSVAATERALLPRRGQPTARQLRLNAELMWAASAEEVVSIAERHHEEFDCVNVSTALGRLRLHGAVSRGADERLASVLQLLLNRLLLEGGSVFGARQLANSAHALAGMQVESGAFFELLARQLRARAAAFRPQELAMALRALAVAGAEAPPGLAEAVAREAEARAEDFSPQEMAILSWSLATLRLPCPGLFGVLCRELAARPSDFTFQELANVAWACGRVRHWDRPAFEAVGAQVAAHAAEFKTQELAMAAWAFARMQCRHEGLLRTVARDLARRPGDYSAHSLTNVAWACAALGAGEAPATAAAAADRAAAAPGEFLPAELVRIAWALAVCGLDGHGAFAAVRASAPALARELGVGDAATLLWSLAASGNADPGALAEAGEALLGRLGDGSPRAWATLAWAFAASQQSSLELFDRLAAVAAPRMADFQPRSLSMLSHAFAAVGHNSPRARELVEAAASEAASRAADFQPSEAVLVLWSMAVVGADPSVARGLASAARLPAAQLNPIDLVQLFQAEVGLGGSLLEDPRLRDACRQAWQMEVSQPATVSETSVEVSDAISGLGLPNRLNARTRDGLLQVDIAVQLGSRLVAVEVDGPGRLCVNPPHLELGRTRLKRKLLQASGLPVVNVRHVDWDRLTSDEARQKHLAQALEKCNAEMYDDPSCPS